MDDKTLKPRCAEACRIAPNSQPVRQTIEPIKWLQLPAELWHTVFGFLAQKQHLTITFVCRRLRSLVEPHLYCQFIWILPEKWVPTPLPNFRDIRTVAKTRRKKCCEFPQNMFSRLPPPYLLLQTLLKRPELAHYFRQARLSADGSTSGLFWSEFEARENALSPSQFDDLTKIIKWMKHLSQEDWLAGLYQGRLDVMVALLFVQMTGLVSIDICLHRSSTIGGAIFEVLGTKPSGIRPGFLDLRSITVSMNPIILERFSWDMVHELVDEFSLGAQLPTLLQIPWIESLSLEFLEFYSLRFEDPLPVASHLKRLRLKFGFMGDPELHHILKATPNLEELEVDLCFDRSEWPDGEWLECDLLSDALCEVKNTLRRLSITINIQQCEYNWDRFGHWNVTGCLKSLPSFEKLQHLALPTILLFGNAEEEGSGVVRDDEGVTYDFENLLPEKLRTFENTGRSWATALLADREAEFALVEYLAKNR